MSHINLPPNAFAMPTNDSPVKRNNALNLQSNETVMDLISPGSYKIYEGDNISNMNSKWALSNTKETLLTFLFFSQENICNLQNIIKHAVYREINYTISNQSYTELLNVMRNVFYEYNNHPEMIREDMTKTQKIILYKKYKNEIARLNNITIDFILPQVISQISGYLFYLDDSSKIAVKEFNPVFTSSKGETAMRSVTSTLVGNNVL